MHKAIAILIAVAAIAALAWFALTGRDAPEPEPLADAPATEPAPRPEPIRYPAPAPRPVADEIMPVEPEVPLPPLGRVGDPAIAERLAEVFGAEQSESIGFADDLVRRIVVTIDNLPRDRVPVRVRPVAPAPGAFEASGDEEASTLAASNYARYEPLVRAVAAAPTDALVDFYARHYPLFQQAYTELGYPDGYFNDRLVEVIDHLLDAPEIDGPIALTRPHVMYEFADPELEALSPGHKLMLRIGPANAAALKTRLRELRAAIVEGE